MVAFCWFDVWYGIETAFWPGVASQNTPDSESCRTEKSETLKAFLAIHTTGRMVSTMALPESSRPKTMIRGEERLVELNKGNNNKSEHTPHCRSFMPLVNDAFSVIPAEVGIQDRYIFLSYFCYQKYQKYLRGKNSDCFHLSLPRSKDLKQFAP